MCEAFMSCFGHSALFEHVITHIDKDLKLFFTCESVSMSASAHDFKHLFFVGDHL